MVGSNLGPDPSQDMCSLARELATVLTATHNGWILHGGQALLEPTVANLKQAVKGAVNAAAENSDTLLITYIGHGLTRQQGAGAPYPEFFLQTRDAPPNPDSDTGVNLGLILRERLQVVGHQVDGVRLLLDACQTGGAVTDAASHWGDLTGGALEVLTASDHAGAYGGSFTKRVIELLTTGLEDAGTNLYPADLRGPINEECTDQRATHLSYAYGRENARGDYDRSLWLSVNPARQTSALFGRPDAGRLDEVTENVTLSPVQLKALAGLEDRGNQRLRWLAGPAGSGKTTLLASRIRPTRRLLGDMRLAGAHAGVFLDSTSTTSGVLREIADQLTATLSEFGPELESSRQRAEGQPVEPLDVELLIPWKAVPESARVQVILDGYDQLNAQQQRPFDELLTRLVTSAELSQLRLLVGSRNGPPRQGLTTEPVAVPAPSWGVVADELPKHLKHALPPANEPVLGGWLTGRLAQRLNTPPTTWDLPTIAAQYFHQLVDPMRDHERDTASLVLSLLSVTPVGPVLPLVLLQGALAQVHHDVTTPSLRLTIASMAPLLHRARPGYPDERIGLAHEELRTLAEVLAHRSPNGRT